MYCYECELIYSRRAVFLATLSNFGGSLELPPDQEHFFTLDDITDYNDPHVMTCPRGHSGGNVDWSQGDE